VIKKPQSEMIVVFFAGKKSMGEARYLGLIAAQNS
jgi:hypothetical protein